MSRTVVKVGDPFNRWVVFLKAGRTKKGEQKWLCRCVCLSMKEVSQGNLVNGLSKSCGCLRFNRWKNSTASLDEIEWRKNYKAEIQAWRSMKRRCSEQASGNDLKNYFLRGIRVCEKWSNSVELFIQDVGQRPSAQHTLERVNNDLGYFPDNVIWATRLVQRHNTRKNVVMTSGGKAIVLKDWCDENGLSYSTVWHRMKKSEWTVDEALNRPVRRTGRSRREQP